MSGSTPQVSVVLPVFNGEFTVGESIRSILSQESVDLELVVVDDASTDESRKIIRTFDDPRIVVVALETNVGLAGALDTGIQVARAALIARQDQDDIAHPRRLKRQIETFLLRSDLVLLGTWAAITSEGKSGQWEKVGEHRHPVSDDELRVRLLWNNPFVHSSVMFRRDAYDSVGGYRRDPVEHYPEDFDLWSRLAQRGELANVPEVLVTYRTTVDGMSRTGIERIHKGVVRIAARNMASNSELPPADRTVVNAVRALNNEPMSDASLSSVCASVMTFWRASREARRGGRHLVAMRARAAIKICVRSRRRFVAEAHV